MPEPLAGQPADDVAAFHQALIGLFGADQPIEQDEDEVRLTRHSAEPSIAEAGNLIDEPATPLSIVQAATFDELGIADRGDRRFLPGSGDVERRADAVHRLDDRCRCIAPAY